MAVFSSLLSRSCAQMKRTGQRFKASFTTTIIWSSLKSSSPECHGLAINPRPPLLHPPPPLGSLGCLSIRENSRGGEHQKTRGRTPKRLFNDNNATLEAWVSALDNKSSVYFDTSRPQRTHSESVMRLLTCGCRLGKRPGSKRSSIWLFLFACASKCLAQDFLCLLEVSGAIGARCDRRHVWRFYCHFLRRRAVLVFILVLGCTVGCALLRSPGSLLCGAQEAPASNSQRKGLLVPQAGLFSAHFPELFFGSRF